MSGLRNAPAGLALAAIAAGLALAAGPARALPAGATAPEGGELRVCADPDNLPFSDDQGRGFENRIAEVVARDLGLKLSYVWQSQRRGFLRRSLNAGACDVVIGAPVGLGGLILTRPYYRSAYVLVTRRDDPQMAHVGLADPALRTARIGLYAIGMEGANTPAAMALARRGITANVQGFPLVGGEPDAPAASGVIDALAAGRIDAAFVWGPFAGYFARPYGTKLAITPVLDDPCLPGMAFAWDMAMGVRAADIALRDRVQAAADRHRSEIAAILADYGVPVIPPAAAMPTTDTQGGASCASHPS